MCISKLIVGLFSKDEVKAMIKERGFNVYCEEFIDEVMLVLKHFIYPKHCKNDEIT